MASPAAFATFSDIHSNFQALEAMLEDMRALGISRTICLGDIVGYAAQPRECLEIVRTMECPVLKGNHDSAVVKQQDFFSMRNLARAGLEFSRKRLSASHRGYLNDLPLTMTMGDCQFVHASLHHPEYWTYLNRFEDMRDHFAVQTEPICFCGHTHVQGVWQLKENDELLSLGGEGRVQLPRDGKILINAGSVGQPRDKRPEACYALFEPEERVVEFRRLPYDIATAKARVLDAGLPPLIGERLESGR
jgi:diadenosine tetraphosphatase ApaH/serine/threonine PP2A family protein phosphatase